MPLRSLAVDFNAFFASCEQQERPELRGHPVAIVPVLAESTSCIAASYLAKARGVRTGTSIAEARQLCPEIRLIAQRPRLYIDYSRQLRAIIESCIHITSVRSIDEVECDLTATFAPREKALAVAREIKTRIGQQIGPCLTSSIGIAPNWLLAKLATDLQKPDGLVVIDDDDLPQKLLGLKLQDFLGVGQAMEARLRAHGIDTTEKLCAASPALLRGIWGGVGKAWTASLPPLVSNGAIRVALCAPLSTAISYSLARGAHRRPIVISKGVREPAAEHTW